LAIAPALVTPTLLALVRGAIAMAGLPAPPTACGGLTLGATVASLGLSRSEPALTALEQAAATTKRPTARP
jgi:hypothetical protein